MTKKNTSAEIKRQSILHDSRDFCGCRRAIERVSAINGGCKYSGVLKETRMVLDLSTFLPKKNIPEQ